MKSEGPLSRRTAEKVGIICNLKHSETSGLNSNDREAEYDSLETVRAIQNALIRHGLDTCVIEQDETLAEKLRSNRVTIAFNIAEGRGGRGRETQVPALLDYLDIPYTGSDAVALGISLDKNITKTLAAAAGVRVPSSLLLHSCTDALPSGTRYPLVVKPNAEGSGKGLSENCVAENEEELREIMRKECPDYPEGLLAEQYLGGREFTVAMIGNGKDLKVFPPMEIIYRHDTQRTFKVYSFQIKCDYRQHVDYQCPADLTSDEEQEVAESAKKVFRALGCRDVARADFRMDSKGRIHFLEINPLPGLAPGYSDLPMITASAGMSYDDTIYAIYEAAAKRLALSAPKSYAEEKAAAGVSAGNWNDWHWQFRNRICDSAKLAERIPLSDKEKCEIDTVCKSFRMAVTPYYLSLIHTGDTNDPIRRMCIPSVQEMLPCANDRTDPLNEDADSPVPHIVYRYPDRVLFLVTMECAEYCRFCTRRRIVGEEDHAISDSEIETAVMYIRKHNEIRDVLISGGDPLTLSTQKLETIVKAVRAIPHVEIIRIGTRVPVVMPMRITQELLDMLKKYQPIWINTHFNHPNELTPDSKLACRMIADAGIPLGNQTVLLNGVNNDLETMKTLMKELVRNRVRPYYLYQCDLSRGISHFRTPVEDGINIVHGLQGFITGFAVPKFVLDCPGGGGKVPINYDYVLSHDSEKYVLENYAGKTYTYPQPAKKEGN
jgi:lysine 2,3-aminomutase